MGVLSLHQTDQLNIDIIAGKLTIDAYLLGVRFEKIIGHFSRFTDVLRRSPDEVELSRTDTDIDLNAIKRIAPFGLIIADGKDVAGRQGVSGISWMLPSSGQPTNLSSRLLIDIEKLT